MVRVVQGGWSEKVLISDVIVVGRSAITSDIHVSKLKGSWGIKTVSSRNVFDASILEGLDDVFRQLSHQTHVSSCAITRGGKVDVGNRKTEHDSQYPSL